MELSVPTQMSTTISVTPSTSPEYISQDDSFRMGSQKRQCEYKDTPAKRLKFSVSREEKLDLQTLKYLLLLILSHEEYKTEAPEWLVSKEPYDDLGTQTKGEHIKSQLFHMYWKQRPRYVYLYKQKEDEDGRYGGWILKKPSDYFTSAHSMKRELRANLFHKNYVDVDISNAFPSLLLGKLKKMRWNPDDYKYLERVVTARKEVIDGVIAEKHCTYERAKKDILAIMFKDPKDEWDHMCDFEKQFESEIKNIQEKLLHDESIDWMKRSKGGHNGSGLSVLLQTMCASCLETGVLELERAGCTVGALIFDGCLVERSSEVQSAIDKLNEVLQRTPEYRFVKFTVKKFKGIVDTKRLCIG